MRTLPLRKEPQPDEAEFNAFFPSKFALDANTAPVSDLTDADYQRPYGGTRKILVLGVDERYLKTEDGKLFSTGNHPIETLVPMYHLNQASFDFDIATVSRHSMKFEFWAMPNEDERITGPHAKYLDKFQNPLKLLAVAASLGPDSDYVAVFIPGDHGPLIDLHSDGAVAATLRWASDNDRHIVAICHGPAALLALAKDGAADFPVAGYSVTGFPDSADRAIPEVATFLVSSPTSSGRGWALGVTIANTEPDESTHKDRKLVTGASPKAANALGRLAAEALLEEVGVS